MWSYLNFKKHFQGFLDDIIIKNLGGVFLDLLVQLLIAFIPATISGFVAYFTANKKAKTELEKIERESVNRIKELRESVEAELKIYEGKLNADSVNDLSMKAFEGDIDFNKIGESLKQISELEKQLKKWN